MPNGSYFPNPLSDASRLIESTWDTANEVLISLAKKTLFQYIRFKPNIKNMRDSKAYFRIRSPESIPEGTTEVVQFTKSKEDPHWVL